MDAYKSFIMSLIGVMVGALLSLFGQYCLFNYQSAYQDSYNVLNQRLSLIDRSNKLLNESYRIDRLTYTPTEIILQELPESINSQVYSYKNEADSVLLYSKLYFGESINNYVLNIESYNAKNLTNISTYQIIKLNQIMADTYREGLFKISFFDSTKLFFIVILFTISLILSVFFLTKSINLQNRIKTLTDNYEKSTKNIKRLENTLDEHIKLIANNKNKE